MYPAFVNVGKSTVFSVYVAVISPSSVPNVYVELLIVPEPDFTFHPANVVVWIISVVCPSLSNVTLYFVGATGVSISVVELYPPCTVFLFVFPPIVPPFGSIVNVYFCSSHCAYNVTSDNALYIVPASPTFVPVVFAVYHPLNVAPVFVALGNVTFPSLYFAVNVPSLSPNVYVVPVRLPAPVNVHLSNVFGCTNCVCVVFPPFASNFTVYPFGAVGFSIFFVVL